MGSGVAVAPVSAGLTFPEERQCSLHNTHESARKAQGTPGFPEHLKLSRAFWPLVLPSPLPLPGAHTAEPVRRAALPRQLGKRQPRRPASCPGRGSGKSPGSRPPPPRGPGVLFNVMVMTSVNGAPFISVYGIMTTPVCRKVITPGSPLNLCHHKLFPGGEDF